MADASRETLLGNVTVRVVAFRPKSVESLIKDLLPFADYLINMTVVHCVHPNGHHLPLSD
ncbi:hypothetical protein [Rhodococcus sp. USK13]|uniref:hypothetical protein n=1 Tax=Rhodococcus sp. USK13 TaxID=2806442 RepID=UPI0020178D2D|nr:hypothetical protein [Rhodococcus sp. USK13]